MSFWSILLYFFIPCALLLLFIILFCHGALQRLNDLAMLLVGRIIFARFNILPFALIQGVLIVHVLMAVVQGTNVYYWQSNHPPLPPGAPLDVAVNYNSKAWRQQRNLYLVCLSLVLWWSANAKPALCGPSTISRPSPLTSTTVPRASVRSFACAAGCCTPCTA